MTRDFKNQRRDDMRPSSRPQSSNRHDRYEDNRSSRPARPRLNRETVDRAWESGAPNQHADYRPRSNNYRGQTPRDNQRGSQRNNQHNHWRDNRQQGQQGQYPRNDRAPYGNRQGNYRRFDDTASEQRPESRPYNPNRRNFDDRPHSDYQSRGYGSRSNYQSRNEGERPHYRGNDRPYESRSSYRDNYQERGGYQRRGNDRYERGPREFERSDRYDSNRRPQRSFDRDNRNSRPPRNDYRDSRNKQAPRNTRDTFNPRWQSRPFAQRDRDNAYPREQFEHRFSQDEQFEGDYERFNSNDDRQQYERQTREERPMRPRRPFNTTRMPAEHEREPEEQHVTHMPDGRVIKGSRPQQRKAAAYWTDIAHNTDDLLEGIEAAPAKQVELPEEEVSPAADEDTFTPESAETATPEEGTSPTEAKPRRRAASAISRSRKVATKKGKPSANGNVPRPSKRGFKWPSP